MSFLNPFFLFGSLALAIPVLIHLVRREKSEIIRFSSLMERARCKPWTRATSTFSSSVARRL